MVRAFNEEEVQTLKQSLIGRALLPPEPGKDKLTKVYIVKSLLEGFEAKYNEDITLSTWPWGLFAATRRWIASHSRSTHWAVEIRGDFYETFRQKQYSWPEWAATLRLTKKELAVNERIVVERLYVGTTACSDREIAGRGTGSPI